MVRYLGAVRVVRYSRVPKSIPWYHAKNSLENFTRRADDLYEYNFMIRIFPRRIYFSILYDLSHAAGWEPYNLHDLARISWAGSVCTINLQILHNLAQRQVRN